ncbi:MAG: hypothetical protein RLZZ519_1324 [Bacteroidota bacterium]|jgi:hypothetical protein
MEQDRAELEKQQRMMLRTIGDIQKMGYKALNSSMNADFELLERANQDFKQYVKDHVQAPEIRDYIHRIPSIQYGPSEPSILRVMTMPFLSLFSGREGRADSLTIRQGGEVKAHYMNLEILVKLMLED